MFPLLRYFSISSAIVTVLVTAGFVAIHRAHEIADIIHEAEDDNAGMARTIANVIWLRYGSQLEELRGSTKAQILALPVIADLQKEVRTIKKGLPILKTKVNLPDGLIVFSSLQEEIGFNRNALFYEGKYDEDFSSAAGGKVVNRTIERRTFRTRHSVKQNLSVVSSYVPILDDNKNVRAVIEIYADITGELALIRGQSWFVALLIVAAFGMTYLILLLLVVRADRTIKCQYKKLEAFNETLEKRVAERSAAAEMAAKEARSTAHALVGEVVQRERAEDDLRKQNLRLDVALQNMSHGLAMFDAQHRLVLCNERYAEIYRIPAKLRAYGTPRRDIIRHRIKSGIAKIGGVDLPADADIEVLLERMIEEDTTRIDELADGRIISIKQHPMPSGGWVATHEDVTEREQDRVRIEAANHAKSEFLATMSHEIRTPMNGMLGMMGLLMGTPLNEEQRILVETARDSGDVLLTVVNDILDYSKIEAGVVSLEIVNFSLANIVDSSLSLLNAKATEKGLSIESAIASGTPPWIFADPTRLRQVLFNLIGNAIKFTERGHVLVQCHHRDVGGDDIELRFDVRDKGIGIPDEARPNLFTRFAQGDGTTTRNFGGSGLGLAICKNLVELMGGVISCTSIPGVGSTFSFTLRCARGRAPLQLATAPANKLRLVPTRRLRVLVAEDNPVNLMLVSMILERAGHLVDKVGNGCEAIEAVKRGHYDVVLMDMQMPVMDGPTAATEIRNLSCAGRHVPIIAVTANVLGQHRMACFASGMNEVLSKPLDSAQLLATIAELTAEPPASADSEERPVLNEARLAQLRRLIGDEAFLQLMMAVPGHALETLQKLKDAIAQERLDETRRIGHDLRGFAFNYGILRLGDLALYLERGDSNLSVVSDLVTHIEDAIEESARHLERIA